VDDETRDVDLGAVYFGVDDDRACRCGAVWAGECRAGYGRAEQGVKTAH
jgi:hypothetical protein